MKTNFIVFLISHHLLIGTKGLVLKQLITIIHGNEAGPVLITLMLGEIPVQLKVKV